MINYYDFLERRSARLLHRLPRSLVAATLTAAGRSGLLSDAGFIPQVVEQSGVAQGTDAKRIASEVLGGLGGYFSDVGVLMHGSRQQINTAFEGRVRVDHPERWRDLADGRYIIFGAHFACFYLAAFAGKDIFPSVSIIRRFQSKGRDALIERLCAITGKQIEVLALSDPQIGLKIVKRLKSGRPIWAMMDFFYSDISMFVTPFMGKDCATPAGLPMIAAKMRIPLLPVFVLRDTPGSYVVKIGEAIRPVEAADDIESAFDLACQMNACIEQAIRAAPTQWTFWPTLPSRWSFADRTAAEPLAETVL
ncbi:lysophospholipid acyltransferase family protein [Rhodopseudomonas palustris]|uniref:Lauroyl/myristoyl acyltransferase-like n=1 Tax=Rhodopseudomonas palustris (strain BisB18) TaxID=316056 RepID=Q216U9_RHOPB